MKLAKKMKRKLQTRIKDFERGPTTNESKVEARWKSGGFHKPGSDTKS